MTAPSLDRLIDLAVYAPIGVALAAREHLPQFVADGRAAVEQRLAVARLVGQVVVAQGRREVERRLSPAPSPPTAAPSPVEAVPTSEVTERPSSDELPIDDYESLAASQVVARLGGLGTEELDAVERFERAHRNRRTVLNRIAQLRSTT